MPRKLRVEYRTEDSFRREYAQNIAKGGLFIPTKHELEVREPVEVELEHGPLLQGELAQLLVDLGEASIDGRPP